MTFNMSSLKEMVLYFNKIKIKTLEKKNKQKQFYKKEFCVRKEKCVRLTIRYTTKFSIVLPNLTFVIHCSIANKHRMQLIIKACILEIIPFIGLIHSYDMTKEQEWYRLNVIWNEYVRHRETVRMKI